MKKTQWKKPVPYRKHIALTIAIISLLPCIALSGMFLNLLYPQWIQSALEQQYDTLEDTSLSLSEQLMEMNQKMQYILADTTIRPYMGQIDNLTLIHKLDLLNRLDETSDALTVANSSMVIRWYPYSSDRNFGSSCIPLDTLAQEFADQDKSEELDRILSLADGKTYWTVRHISRDVNNQGRALDRLCLYTQFGAFVNPNCVLELTIPISQLYRPQDYGQIENSLFVFSQNSASDVWNIVFETSLPNSQVTALLDTYRSQGQCAGYHVLSMYVPNIPDGQVLFFIPNAYVRVHLLPHFLTFFGIILMVIALVVATSYITSHVLTKRVLKLIDQINDNLDSYFCDTAQHDYNSSSVAHISARIEQLIQKTQMYCSQVEYYETENARMELELLQMRFNPHLLYNTLSTLKYHISDPIFQQTIDALCRYYRIILNNGHLQIRMKDELEMIRQYLFVLKSAYGLTNIEYRFDVDEAVNNCSVIKHILQPIVENAINHGLKPCKRPGLLTVKAHLDQADVVIDVTDNGIGMSPEIARQLLTEPMPLRFSGGYGVYNVQQRIQLYYGPKYGLTVESTAGAGTSVRVRIPAQTDPI